MVVAVAPGPYSVGLEVCPTCAGTTVCSLASAWTRCHAGQGGSSPGISHPCQTVSLKRTGKWGDQCSTLSSDLKPESDAHARLGLGLLQEGFGINKNRAAQEAVRWGLAGLWGCGLGAEDKCRCLFVPRPVDAGDTVLNTQAGALPPC